jgi:Fur family transcriptional regulator, stress-responsive regulator
MNSDQSPERRPLPAREAAQPGAGQHGLVRSIDELSGRLRAEGLRVTGPRLLVYQTLERLGGHHSADEVAGEITNAGPGLPRTSVYNALKALVDVGLVQVVDAGPGTTLYEVRHEDHHHLLCRICGQLSDVPGGQQLDGILQAGAPGAVIESAQVLLRGICAGCTGGTAANGSSAPA